MTEEVQHILTLLVAQSKKVEREARIEKQLAARLRDALQASEATRTNEQSNTSAVEEE